MKDKQKRLGLNSKWNDERRLTSQIKKKRVLKLKPLYETELIESLYDDNIKANSSVIIAALNCKYIQLLNYTLIESKINNIFKKLGVHYEYQKIIYVGDWFYVVDFYCNNIVFEPHHRMRHSFEVEKWNKRNALLLENQLIDKVIPLNNLDAIRDISKIEKIIIKELEL